MQLEEIRKRALQVPEADRAEPLATLLDSLPSVALDYDDGLREAQRTLSGLDTDRSMRSSQWETISQLPRP